MYMNWVYKSFEELNGTEMYELLKLRSLVFVVEQDCVFLDIDDKDQESFHLLGYEDDALVAYSRIVPAGVSYTEISIGRVVTHPSYRRKGLGKELMETSIAWKPAAVKNYGHIQPAPQCWAARLLTRG